MGRSTRGKSRLTTEPMLWPEHELPRSAPKLPERHFAPLLYPLWTQNKARLIQAYLQLFEYITKHGTYIDGFAGPQDAAHLDMWSAKLVLDMTPKWFRDFWLCDISRAGIAKLRTLQAEHASSKRRVTILEGDFNEKVYDILQSGRITEKTATFALLDQRTFECQWRTVEALSRFKSGNKIESFYFFPTGWVDRSLAAVSKPETKRKVEAWWGRADWDTLQGMDGTARALLVAQRFEDELGFGKATPYSIHSDRRGGRVMYHMIHATDHPEASSLMARAYRKVSGRPEVERHEIQLCMGFEAVES
jgi:three-Cys-motif partner protein